MTDNTINGDVTMGGAETTLLAGRYRVVRQLGQGGMGSVWLAEDTQLDNRQVAIKMLPSVLVSNKRAYQQLKAEALVSLKLTHPNIATVRAFEENNGNPFLVVDYIDGITLDDYLFEKCDAGRAASTRPPHVDAIVSIASERKDKSSSDAFETNASTDAAPHPNGLPESEVIRLLAPIAAALDYAHSKGVVHRDVKPGNVMIAKDGTPYILDFGIAREIQETMTRVTGKLSSGTLMYMSPEQLNGDAPSAAQDVYSFAAMAYECLTGAPPFSRGNIEYQILNKTPAPLTLHVTKCGAGVMAGLAKSPEERPCNCAEVLTECETEHSSRKDGSAPTIAKNDPIGENDSESNDQIVASDPLPQQGALNDETHRRNSCFWARFVVIPIVGCTVALSLFAFAAHRLNKEIEKPARTAMSYSPTERVEYFELNCAWAVSFGILILILVATSCAGGTDRLRIKNCSARVTILFVLIGTVVLGTCCFAQASFLNRERGSRTVATSAYSDQELDEYIAINQCGGMAWLILGMSILVGLVRGAKDREGKSDVV